MPHLQNISPSAKGYVVLAGAGPGDEDLITIRLQKQLPLADVIVTDRLVNPLIIEKYKSPQAIVLFGGKQGYSDKSVSQQEINKWIVEHALQGKRVLRLKGGDIAFFSNVYDELLALQEHDIPFEIIPGITAASGASSYCGMPLTARGISSAVHIMSFGQGAVLDDTAMKALAKLKCTLVIYMAVSRLWEFVTKLMKYGYDTHKPIAVVEQATTSSQKIHVSTVSDCCNQFSEYTFSSPTLIIIGDVVNMAKDFTWYNPTGDNSIFRELV